MQGPLGNKELRGKEVIWTQHALERMQEYSIDPLKAKVALKRSHKEHKPYWLIWDKLKKYGHWRLNYYSHNDLFFTVDEKKDKVIVVTVTRVEVEE